MSTKTFCDKCNCQKNEDAKGGWSYVRVAAGFGLKVEGVDPLWTNFELCTKCAKIMLPKVVELLKRK